MPDRITISAPSRLHFGLFSVGDAVARKFGGVGLMIDSPRTVVSASRAAHFQIEGPASAVCRKAIQNWFETTRHSLTGSMAIDYVSQLPVKLKIKSVPPRHSGFGSGTQLALSSALAVNRLLDISNPGPRELAAAIGRGQRSGIGSHGFYRGGILVDRGKLNQEPLAPLDFQSDFPEHWTIVTVILNDAKGLSGDLESNAFKSLPETNESQRDEMIEIVRGKIIPGVMQRKFESFAEGVFEFGRRSGMMFAEIQNGPYNGTAIEALISQIRDFGIKAVGQSSWGPCVFAITRNDEQARKLVTFLRSKHGDCCEIQVSKADNAGAKTIQPETVEAKNR